MAREKHGGWGSMGGGQHMVGKHGVGQHGECGSIWSIGMQGGGEAWGWGSIGEGGLGGR